MRLRSNTNRKGVSGVGVIGFLSLGFGCIVSSGWVVLLGQWIEKAGPLGAVCALVLGATVMTSVALAYGELCSRMPSTGADYLFTRTAFGPLMGFGVGWLLILRSFAVLSFEAIALGWILECIIPRLKTLPAYVLFSVPVTSDTIIMGLLCTGGIAILNVRGVRASTRFQSWSTSIFLIVSTVVLLSAGLLGHQGSHIISIEPGALDLSGSLWVLSTCLIIYNGFQVIPQAIESRSDRLSVRTISLCMPITVLAACIFYVGLILCGTSAAPWRWIITQPLPAFAAVDRALPGSGVVLLIAASISLIKSWNASFIYAVQTVIALSRDGLLPKALMKRNEQGAYATAIFAVSVINGLGVLLGKGAVIPLIGAACLCIGAINGSACLAVYWLRKRDGPAPLQLPGGLCTLAVAFGGTCLMALFSVLQTITGAGGLVEVFLLVGWLLMGVGLYTLRTRSFSQSEVI